jgi:hypothetical protein
MVGNDAYMAIKGHAAGFWGREQTTRAVDSDFQPGASFAGALGQAWRVARHPVRAFQAWKFGRRLTQGAALYESMARYALARQGVVPASVRTYVAKPALGEADIYGTIGLEVTSKTGEELITSVRAFSPKEIELADVMVSESLRGKGVGGFLKRGEMAIFQRMGYKPGTRVVSEVVNPIAARMQLQLYGGKLTPHSLQRTAEAEYARLGVGPKRVGTFEERVLAKEYAVDDFFGAHAEGHLPSNTAYNKIVAHDIKWGRSWVERVLESDFRTGSSWKNSYKWLRNLTGRIFRRGPAAEWATIQKHVSQASELHYATKDPKKFVQKLDVIPVEATSELFPAAKVSPFKGRTAGYLEEIEGMQQAVAIPMVASPKLLVKHGYSLRSVEEFYRGTALHEKMEAVFMRKGVLGAPAHKQALLAQGLFFQKIGMSMKELKNASHFLKADLPALKQGWKYGEKLAKSVESVQRAKRLNRISYQENATGIGLKMNHNRINSKQQGY